MSDLPPFPDAGHLSASSGKNVCDFCCPGVHDRSKQAQGKWYYPCKSFQFPHNPVPERLQRDHWSRGDWAACEACAVVIEKGPTHAEQLARRCRLLFNLNGFQLDVMHLFFANRKDEPRYPVTDNAIRYEASLVEPLQGDPFAEGT